eukprot:1160235-Pelagomonas_calceolata.AAC.10
MGVTGDECAAGVQVLTNAGQANAATGEQGYKDALECAATMADALGVSRDDVMLQSTGAGVHGSVTV